MRILAVTSILAMLSGAALAGEDCAPLARAEIARADRLPCAEAWDVYERALACKDLVEVDAGRVRARQSRCLSEQGRHEDASDYADWALHLMPGDRATLLLHARMMLAAGQFDAALASLRQVREQAPAEVALSPPINVAVRGRVFPMTPSLAVDDLPQSQSVAELLAHLPEELAGPAMPMSDADILGEVEERTWATQFQLEDAIADRARGSVQVEDRLVSSLGQRTASPELQALHDEHQALHLLARGLRVVLGHPARPPGLGHFTRSTRTEGTEALEAIHRLRAAYRAQDIRLLDRAANYPVKIIGPTGKEHFATDRSGLAAARASIFSPGLRARILGQGIDGLEVSAVEVVLADGRVTLGGKGAKGLVRVDSHGLEEAE